MPERLRTVIVTVTVDTNKATTTETYELDGDENTDELMARAAAGVNDIIGAMA